jgi:hypothetical protein
MTFILVKGAGIDLDSGRPPAGRQGQNARMAQMAMNVSFSGHLPIEVIGTLATSKQLEGLVTLGMYGSHKALCPDPVTAGPGLFCFGHAFLREGWGGDS